MAFKSPRSAHQARENRLGSARPPCGGGPSCGSDHCYWDVDHPYVLRSPLDYVLPTGVAIGALGLAALGAWMLVTRRVPQPLLRLRGEVGSRPQPVRLGGFWLLAGTAI